MYDLHWKEPDDAVRAAARTRAAGRGLVFWLRIAARASLTSAAIWAVVCGIVHLLVPDFEFNWTGYALAIVGIPPALALQVWVDSFGTSHKFRLTGSDVRRNRGDQRLRWRDVVAYRLEQGENPEPFTVIVLHGRNGTLFRMTLPEEPLASQVLLAVEHLLPGKRTDSDPIPHRDEMPPIFAAVTYVGGLMVGVLGGWTLARSVIAGREPFLMAGLIVLTFVAMVTVLLMRWRGVPYRLALVWALSTGFLASMLVMVFGIVFLIHETMPDRTSALSIHRSNTVTQSPSATVYPSRSTRNLVTARMCRAPYTTATLIGSSRRVS